MPSVHDQLLSQQLQPRPESCRFFPMMKLGGLNWAACKSAWAAFLSCEPGKPGRQGLQSMAPKVHGPWRLNCLRFWDVRVRVLKSSDSRGRIQFQPEIRSLTAVITQYLNSIGHWWAVRCSLGTGTVELQPQGLVEVPRPIALALIGTKCAHGCTWAVPISFQDFSARPWRHGLQPNIDARAWEVRMLGFLWKCSAETEGLTLQVHTFRACLSLPKPAKPSLQRDISPRLNCASAWPTSPAFSNHRAASWTSRDLGISGCQASQRSSGSKASPPRIRRCVLLLNLNAKAVAKHGAQA